MNRSRQSSRIRELKILIILTVVLVAAGLITHQILIFFAAFILLATAIFVPSLARVIAQGWQVLGTMIGTFNNKLILSMVFYLFLTPIALLYRRFNRNQMKLDRDNGAISFYNDRNHNYDKTDLEKMW